MSTSSRWWPVLASLVLAAAVIAPAGPAVAAEDATVTFAGAGWGHGLGLSQYGAYGASQDGWTVDQITGTFIRARRSAPWVKMALRPKRICG